ncbi:MAG: hypothetical protein RRY95_02275 [Oscillospiraceae bacterium]
MKNFSYHFFLTNLALLIGLSVFTFGGFVASYALQTVLSMAITLVAVNIVSVCDEEYQAAEKKPELTRTARPAALCQAA